jgi:DNA mismatch endonuclease (patch repair protein)
MAKIRSQGTVPEQRLYELVRKITGKRRKIERNARWIIGSPDVFIPSLRLTIFCDGCFYHCCPKHGHIPKSNVDYWANKLERNSRRDRANRKKLREEGFIVLRLWEHDLRITQLDRASRVVRRTIESIVAIRAETRNHQTASKLKPTQPWALTPLTLSKETVHQSIGDKIVPRNNPNPLKIARTCSGQQSQPNQPLPICSYQSL